MRKKYVKSNQLELSGFQSAEHERTISSERERGSEIEGDLSHAASETDEKICGNSSCFSIILRANKPTVFNFFLNQKRLVLFIFFLTKIYDFIEKKCLVFIKCEKCSG